MNKPCLVTIGSEVPSVNCPLVCVCRLVRNLCLPQSIVQPAAWFGTPGRPNHSESEVGGRWVDSSRHPGEQPKTIPVGGCVGETSRRRQFTVNACLGGVGQKQPRALMDPCWGFDVTKSGLGLVFPTPHRKAFTVNAPLCGVGFLEPPVDTIFRQGVGKQVAPHLWWCSS
jgi:hypothetical protein